MATRKVQKAFVTNSGDKDDKPEGKVGLARGLLETGLKTFGKKGDKPGQAGADGDDTPEADSKGFNPVETGLKVLDLLGEARNDADGSAGAGCGSEPQKVFVVNASAFGGGGPGGAAGAGDQRRSRRNRRRGGAGGRRSGSPAPPPTPPDPPRAGRLARLTGAAGRIGDVAKMVPGGKLLDAGMMALDTFQNAETQDEKAEGYGGAAGGVGGALAGAAAGAALGSIVPVIGTAVGGAVGAFLGGMGGESLGGFLGKALFGSDDKPKAVVEASDGSKSAPGDVVRAMEPAAPAQALPAIVKAAEQSKPEPPKVDQQFTFSPHMPVSVQGDVKDPAQLARGLAPYLKQQFDEFSRQAAARQMFDTPDVA